MMILPITLTFLLLAQSTVPPGILQIFREPLKSGVEAEYAAIEDDTKRLCVELGCPHPYLGVESLTGPKEVWYFNAYGSSEEIFAVRPNWSFPADEWVAADPSFWQ
jgi:hypothetical protein